MGTRFFKSLFFGSSNQHSIKTGSGSYDSTVALQPPLKGSYPVAGNGPSVQETLQRAREKRDAKQNDSQTSPLVSNIISRTPSRSKRRGEATQQALSPRPKTAPNDGEPGGRSLTGAADERPRSGLPATSPNFHRGRRSSLQSGHYPPPLEPLPLLPDKQAGRAISSYQPTKGPIVAPAPLNNLPEVAGFTPPFAQKQHHRNFSRSSQSAHVDVLEAHSNIVGKEEASTNREAASGVREYGEDVADRNIASFGDQRLDLNSPEFGYIKSVYGSKKRKGGESTQLKTSQTPAPRREDGLIITYDNNRTFITPEPTPVQNGPAPRSCQDQSFFDPAPEQRSRALSPPPSLEAEAPSPKNPHRTNSDPVDPNLLPRGRQVRESNGPGNLHPRVTSLILPNSRFASAIPESPTLPHFQNPPPVGPPVDSRSSSRNTTNQRPASRSFSRTSPVTYSAFPSISPRESLAVDPPQSSSRPMSNGDKRSYSQERAKEPSKIDGIVDLRRTVDTDVSTKTLHAVTDEYDKPRNRKHRKENSAPGAFNHDVAQRVPPKINTNVLPTHYIHSPDDRSPVDAPEVQLRKRSVSAHHNSRMSEISPHFSDRQDHGQRAWSLGSSLPKHMLAEVDDDDEAAEPPVIALARSEPFQSKSNGSRGHSRSSVFGPKSNLSKHVFDQLRSSERESISADGSGKRESAWRHSSLVDNYSRPSSSRSANPVYIGAGIGDISSPAARPTSNSGRDFYFSDGTDEPPSPDLRSVQEGEDVLFRDSGYGSGGGLPGIRDGGRGLIGDPDRDRSRLGHVAKRAAGSGEALMERGDESEDEVLEEKFRIANRKLREIRERRGDLRAAAQSMQKA